MISKTTSCLYLSSFLLLCHCARPEPQATSESLSDDALKRILLPVPAFDSVAPKRVYTPVALTLEGEGASGPAGETEPGEQGGATTAQPANEMLVPGFGKWVPTADSNREVLGRGLTTLSPVYQYHQLEADGKTYTPTTSAGFFPDQNNLNNFNIRKGVFASDASILQTFTASNGNVVNAVRDPQGQWTGQFLDAANNNAPALIKGIGGRDLYSTTTQSSYDQKTGQWIFGWSPTQNGTPVMRSQYAAGSTTPTLLYNNNGTWQTIENSQQASTVLARDEQYWYIDLVNRFIPAFNGESDDED